MKVLLFLIMITAGEPPQRQAVEVENIKACYEQLGKLLSQPPPKADIIQVGCAILQPGTPA